MEEIQSLSPDRSLLVRDGRLNDPCSRSDLRPPPAACPIRRPSVDDPGSTFLAGAVARGDVDLVDLVPVSVGFAEDRAMTALMRDARDRERVFLPAAAESDGDRVADGDPRGQAYVVIRLTGAGHEP